MRVVIMLMFYSGKAGDEGSYYVDVLQWEGWERG